MERYRTWMIAGMVLGLASFGGCGSDSNQAVTPVTPVPTGGGTGAFGVVTVNGVQKLYLPLTSLPSAATTHQIAVVNVGLAGNGTAGAPALIKNIDLGTTTEYATTTGGDATIVVAASTNYPMVWFIDPRTETVLSSLTLDATYGKSDFSGGGGYVTGIAMDSARHEAILSVWNGFAVVDTNTRTIVRTVLAAPSENFGYDVTKHRILAPFYDCTSSRSTGAGAMPPPCADYGLSEGLNVIDLDDNPASVYTYPTAIDEPDSAAVDTSTGVVVVPSEGSEQQYVIDLGAGVFDTATHKVTATNHTVSTGVRSEGVSIDPVKHLAFFEGESSSNVGVMDLVAANMGTGKYLGATMPALPTGGSWSNISDPHGIAVTTGILNQEPVGFVVNSSRQWVARVDLQKMVSLLSPTDAGTTSGIAAAVTFLDAQTIAP